MSQITGHTISAFSSCHCRGSITNCPVVLSYCPSLNPLNYVGGALCILLVLHLLYPHGQEFTICIPPINSMFVLTGFSINPSHSYALIDFGPISIHMQPFFIIDLYRGFYSPHFHASLIRFTLHVLIFFTPAVDPFTQLIILWDMMEFDWHSS